MGYDIEIRVGDFKSILKMIVKGGCKDRKLVKKAMETMGIHAGKKFIILYDEYHEEWNPMNVLTSFLQYHFKVDVSGNGFNDDCIYAKLLDMMKVHLKYELCELEDEILTKDQIQEFNKEYERVNKRDE
jgi:hypothetical protein